MVSREVAEGSSRPDVVQEKILGWQAFWRGEVDSHRKWPCWLPAFFQSRFEYHGYFEHVGPDPKQSPKASGRKNRNTVLALMKIRYLFPHRRTIAF